MLAAHEFTVLGFQKHENQRLEKAIADIRALDTTTAHPLMLHLMGRLDQGNVDVDTVVGCFTDIASFVLRRTVCGDSTRSYGLWFCEAITKLGEKEPRKDLQNYFGARGWPSDERFTAELKRFSFYTREPRKCRLVLEQLERSTGHKEVVDLSDKQIEHVMPQTITDDTDGKDW